MVVAAERQAAKAAVMAASEKAAEMEDQAVLQLAARFAAEEDHSRGARSGGIHTGGGLGNQWSQSRPQPVSIPEADEPAAYGDTPWNDPIPAQERRPD